MDMAAIVRVLMSGLFAAAVSFLVAAGLQVILGVRRVINLACGSFYALGAFAGVTAVEWGRRLGLPTLLLPLVLVVAGLALGTTGVALERLLRLISDRDEVFQLLLTFAVVLMLEDVTRLGWGTEPRSTGDLYLSFGHVRFAGAAIPVYQLLVIGAATAVGVTVSLVFRRTSFGRVVRAAAENPTMSAALGVDVGRVSTGVFVIGTALSTLGGALVIPVTATQSEMGVELMVVAFAVVVIGGLGSMAGALVGALAVGMLRAVAVAVYPEAELLVVYLVVVAVLVLRPQGLFGRAALP